MTSPKPNPASPRFLLLQARNPGDPMAQHEVDCFAAALGVPSERVNRWDLLHDVPDSRALEQTDLILVGGSGDYSVLDDEPYIHRFLDFLADVVVARSIPTFASCFGFQALVASGGGSMVRDPDRAEVGTFTIHLTADGQRDLLLGDLSRSFKAQLGHKDRAERLPAGMTNLARSERASCQALRVDGTQIVATQFHPELTRADNAFRYKQYQASYASSAAGDVDEVLATLEESPEATALLPRWAAQALADV